MISIRTFLQRVRSAWSNVEVRYLHPSLFVIVVDDRFRQLGEEERTSLFYGQLGVEGEDGSLTVAAGNITLCLVTCDERSTVLGFVDTTPPAHHWIEYLSGATPTADNTGGRDPRLIHFYGYKGGQGRSTVLAMVAKSLADDGYRVLVIDADIEAPSLHVQFDLRIDPLQGTLLGCVQHGLRPSPSQAYVPRASDGRVDLIACKPSSSEYDLDLAVLALNATLNPISLQDGFGRLLVEMKGFDYIFVDHRSGLASSTLSLIASFPAPVVVCVRLDEQSAEALEYVRALLRMNLDAPGLFVSFSLDPEETVDRIREKSAVQIESLLEIVTCCLNESNRLPDSSQDDDLTPDAVQSYWVSWYHDRSFLTKPLPTVNNMLSVNRDALFQIREVLGIAPRRRAVLPSKIASPLVLTNSGNTDEGVLIQTEALRQLRSSNSSYRYIFGRKGTGKTRLVRALVDEDRGSTILTAEDVGIGGAISSAEPLFTDVSRACFINGFGLKLETSA